MIRRISSDTRVHEEASHGLDTTDQQVGSWPFDINSI